jgi:hypothetical protein
MKGLVIWLLVIVAVILIYNSSNSPKNEAGPIPTGGAETAEHPYTPSDAPTTSGYPSTRDADSHARSTFDGHTCTADCGGHRAGYRWAEEHDIDDENDCEAAGDNSNSPSFADGCKAFVNGDSDDDPN